MNLTKEDLYNTKWDASQWTQDMKIKWQEKMFEFGFSWYGDPSGFKVESLQKECYYIYQ